MRAMKRGAPRARAALMEVLCDRGATSAVPAVIDEMGRMGDALRVPAFKALGRLAGAEHVPALVALLVGLQGDAGRKQAEMAVALAARKSGDEAARADAALAALGKATSAEVRLSLIRVLGGIANVKALAAVQAALTDKDAAIRDAAVRELANWPTAAAADPLLGVLRTTQDKVHRVLALRGYARLLGLDGAIPSAATLAGYETAMRHATTPQTRTLVLGALARVAHPAALKLVEPHLAAPAVRAEAELAALGVARAIAGAAPETAGAALTRLARSAQSADVRKQAQQTLTAIGKRGDYVVAWQVCGPFLKDGMIGSQLLHAAFPPEQGDADAAWRLLPLGAPGKPWMLDLAGALGAGEHRVCYVRTWLHSDKAQPARLEFGTDDGNKAWLNGKLVHAKNVGGAAVPGGYKANVALRKGWNALVLKVTQWSGPWQFCLAIRGRDGGKLDRVQTDCLYPKGESP